MTTPAWLSNTGAGAGAGATPRIGSLLALGRFGQRQSDLVLAALVVAMLAMMIVPLPPFGLDVMVALNFAIAVTLLFAAIYVGNALRITSFPTLLLLTTLFRLAIEVSATRLILLRANAGSVIHSFGSFVVAGNLVVGVVVFAILTLIQFVVIAKGSERVAEVAARFTLDALPGKQMAIDAELRAGLLDQAAARARRAGLARESQFFGAMDGAMKFVRGDAIAGIAVLAINVVGGFVIGMAQRHMDAGTAARTYVLLTVGEGLVAQLPALLISTAAGVLVTRVASEDDGAFLGQDIARQLLAEPRAIAAAATLMAILAIVPGLPAAPFLILALVLATLAWGTVRARGTKHGRRTSIGTGASGAAGATVARERARAPGPTLTVELGADAARRLAPRGDFAALTADWSERATARLFDERGIALPAIEVRAGDATIPADGFRLSFDGLPLATRPGPAPDSASGDREDRARTNVRAAMTAGPNADDGGGADARASFFAAVYAALARHAFELVGIQETQALLDRLRPTHPALIAEVVPNMVSLPRLAEILRRLAREGTSLAPLREILGALAGAPEPTADVGTLVERARVALGRALTAPHVRADGTLPALLLEPMVEDAVREAIHAGPEGRVLAMEPALARELIAAVGATLARAAAIPRSPVIVVADAEVRPFVRRLLESDYPNVAVLSYAELAAELQVDPLGYVGAGGPTGPTDPGGPAHAIARVPGATTGAGASSAAITPSGAQG